MELVAVTIDCSNAENLADFYAKLTGGEVTFSDADMGYAQTTFAGATLNFQQVHSYTPPQWPGQGHAQQFHLDLRVQDLAAAVDHATQLGATEALEQPNADDYRVMIDPDGHPFCLCPPSAG